MPATPTPTETVSFPVAPPISFVLPCPCCGEAEAHISVRLGDLATTGAFFCGMCEEDFSHANLRNIIRKWSAVLRWLDTVPTFDEEEV